VPKIQQVTQQMTTSISHSKHIHSVLKHSDPNQKLRRHYRYIQPDEVLPIVLFHKSKQFNDSGNINNQVGVASGASVNQFSIPPPSTSKPQHCIYARRCLCLCCEEAQEVNCSITPGSEKLALCLGILRLCELGASATTGKSSKSGVERNRGGNGVRSSTGVLER